MNCFIRGLKYIYKYTEEQLRTLVAPYGITYEDLEVEGLRIEQAYIILTELGYKFYNNLDLRERITLKDTKLFQKGTFFLIYKDHVVAIDDNGTSDKYNPPTRQMIGFFYKPTELNASIYDSINPDEFEYLAHGEHRIVFKINDTQLCKIALSDAGYEENVHDLLFSGQNNFINTVGNEKFIIQEILTKDTTEKFKKQMSKMAHDNGYDNCQYGIDKNGNPKFYDTKISLKNAESLKLAFTDDDLPIFLEWVKQKTNLSFIDYYKLKC